MSETSTTRCPFCGQPVDPGDPTVVYAVESAEAMTMGGSRFTYGLGGWFHVDCPPEAVGYRRPRPKPPPSYS